MELKDLQKIIKDRLSKVIEPEFVSVRKIKDEVHVYIKHKSKKIRIFRLVNFHYEGVDIITVQIVHHWNFIGFGRFASITDRDHEEIMAYLDRLVTHIEKFKDTLFKELGVSYG